MAEYALYKHQAMVKSIMDFMDRQTHTNAHTNKQTDQSVELQPD